MNECHLVLLSDIRPEPLLWLWPNRIPLRALTVVDGDPAQGKTSLLYDVAARVTTGRPMPYCHGQPEPRGVVLLQAEDNLSTTVQPRLQAAGADLRRILAYNTRRAQSLLLPDNLDHLEVQAVDIGARLVVIDPFAAFLRNSTVSAAALRKTLDAMMAWADRGNLAIVLVRHLTKGGTANALYRGAGSMALIGAARSGLVVGHDPGSDDPYRHLLAQTKTNLATADSLLYRTVKEGDVIKVEWLGKSTKTAQDLIVNTAEGSALWEATVVLYGILKDGPVSASDALKAGKHAGVAERTLRRAKQQLGVESRMHGSGPGSHWTWHLPNDEDRLRPLKDKYLDELMERLIDDEDGPATQPA